MLKLKQTIVFLFVVLIANIGNAQCAMCKAVIESGETGMAEGVNNGITYLMVFPYILVGVLLFVLYSYKRTAKN